LALAVVPEDLDGIGVQADRAGPAALGRALDPLPGDDGCQSGDVDLRGIQVDVSPAQVQQLAAAGAGVSGKVIEGEQHPRTRRQAVPRATLPGDRAARAGRAVLHAPGILSPRKDHTQGRSLRSRR
jgi:hypothetical protein